MAKLIYLLREDWYKPGTVMHLSACGVHVGYWLACSCSPVVLLSQAVASCDVVCCTAEVGQPCWIQYPGIAALEWLHRRCTQCSYASALVRSIARQ